MRTPLRVPFVGILTLLLFSAPAAVAQHHTAHADDPGTLTDLVVATDDLSTLRTAVVTAGLADALAGDGPFTVFAPQNAAFDALPDGTVDALLADSAREQLTGVLTYHVVAGKYTSGDLRDGQTLETLSGERLTVSIRDGRVMINDAEVVAADVMASNGVAHVVSGVLLPPAASTGASY